MRNLMDSLRGIASQGGNDIRGLEPANLYTDARAMPN